MTQLTYTGLTNNRPPDDGPDMFINQIVGRIPCILAYQSHASERARKALLLSPLA